MLNARRLHQPGARQHWPGDIADVDKVHRRGAIAIDERAAAGRNPAI